VKLFRPRWALLLMLALGILATHPALAAKRKKRTVHHAKPVPAAPATRAMVLPFIQNDYARALKEARARQVPIFIESWAPW
jgi:hypothetical protein